MRVAIYGAGAMGTVLGAFIAKNGGEADLITRNREHVAALKAGGAHITGTVDFTVPVHALLPEEMQGQYDIIFLMTKQRHNAEILRFLLPYIKEDGVVCTTQNGLPEPSVAAVVGEERCCGCAVSWGATFVGRGEAKLTTRTDGLEFALGTLYNNAQKLEAAFYGTKENPEPAPLPKPQTASEAAEEDPDTLKILQLLQNPETAALLKQLAKAL